MSTRVWTSIKQYEDILFESFEGIAKITINRPEVYNAFRPKTNFEILDALEICKEDSSLKSSFLTAEGIKVFLVAGVKN